MGVGESVNTLSPMGCTFPDGTVVDWPGHEKYNQLKRNLMADEHLRTCCNERPVKEGVAVSEWISVNDGIPDNDRLVLLSYDGRVEIGNYLHRYKEWYYGDDSWACTPCKLTHWQELPDLPEGK